jgi:hypothetical protein
MTSSVNDRHVSEIYEHSILCRIVLLNHEGHPMSYEGVSKSFQAESITKYKLTTINTQEATQRVMVAKLTRLTHKIAIQLHLVADSCTICSSHSRQLVKKLLDTPSYVP